MDYTRRIVVVHGYGCRLVPELTSYLDRTVRFVNEHQPAHLILTGGFTQQKTCPGVSEAALMAIYIRERLAHVPRIHLEEESYTTFGNVRNARNRIQRLEPVADAWQGPDPRRNVVTVFCEAQRALKTLVLYWLLMRESRPDKIGIRLTVETASWELGNPVKELIKTGNEILAIVFPPLAWWMERTRRKKSLVR